MNNPDLNRQWFELLAILAGEVLVLALFLWATQRLKVSAGWRRTFCQAAILGAILVFSFELSGSGRQVAGWAGDQIRKAPAKQAREKAVEVSQANPDFETRQHIKPQLAQRTEEVTKSTRAPTLMIPEPVEARAEGVTPSAEGVIQFGEPVKSNRAAFWLALIWLAGTAVFGARTLGARWLFAIFLRRRNTVTDEQILARVQAWTKALGIHRRVRVVESPRLTSPIAFGVLRPTVGLPANFAARFEGSKREAILAHEMAHIAANDPFWGLLADLATALLWWHPAVWWMRSQLQSVSELAADEASLLIDDGPRALSECLVELGKAVASGPVLGHLRARGFRSSLGCRVQRLMEIEEDKFRPPHRARAVMVKVLGPMVLTAIVTIGSAWAVPRATITTTGQTMKNIQLNRSLATLALVAAFGGIDTAQIATAQGSGSGQGPGLAAPTPQGPGRGSGTPGFGYGAAAAPEGFDQPTPGGAAFGGYNPGDPSAPYAHYPGGPQRGRQRPGDPERGARLEAKLKEIVLEEVSFDSLPLTEVLRFVSEQSRKQDPEKKGLNFLINPNAVWNHPAPAVDPTTGLPITVVAEQADVSSIMIKFNLPLRNVSMRDLLDAIVKVADRPIDYTIEDYAVVFSLRPDAGSFPGPQMQRFQPRPMLTARTFRVDTNTFAAGMESAFGIKMDGASGGKGGPRSQQVQSALKELMAQLGIPLENNKAIFYNERTGVLMVRATPEDLEVVQAAIETLGGSIKDQAQTEFGGYGAGVSPGGFTDPLSKDAFRRRYGLNPGGQSAGPPNPGVR